jgi:hypothetical protein
MWFHVNIFGSSMYKLNFEKKTLTSLEYTVTKNGDFFRHFSLFYVIYYTLMSIIFLQEVG